MLGSFADWSFPTSQADSSIAIPVRLPIANTFWEQGKWSPSKSLPTHRES
jgi:hypothetical protein